MSAIKLLCVCVVIELPGIVNVAEMGVGKRRGKSQRMIMRLKHEEGRINVPVPCPIVGVIAVGRVGRVIPGRRVRNGPIPGHPRDILSHST